MLPKLTRGRKHILKRLCWSSAPLRLSPVLDAKIIGWFLGMQGLARQVPAMASDATLYQRLGDDGHRLAVTAHNRSNVAVKYLVFIKKSVGRENSAIPCSSVDR
jgi:hypothetical protein